MKCDTCLYGIEIKLDETARQTADCLALFMGLDLVENLWTCSIPMPFSFESARRTVSLKEEFDCPSHVKANR